MSKWW